MPEMSASGRSSTRKAAKLAVYEEIIIMVKQAQNMPSTRPLRERGVLSPMPELRSTPHVNQRARDKLSASSSVLLLVLN